MGSPVSRTGYLKVQDLLGTDLANLIYALLDDALDGKAEMLSGELDLDAAAAWAPALTQFTSSTFDVVFVFATQRCTIELASGQTINLEKDGYAILVGYDYAYFELTMGATAGTVVYILAG